MTYHPQRGHDYGHVTVLHDLMTLSFDLEQWSYVAGRVINPHQIRRS